MKNVRTVIWDLDGVVWFHKREEPEILAKAMGIAEQEEFATEFYDFFATFIEYFRDKKVTEDETLKVIEQKMPILYFYGYTPGQFLKVQNRIKLFLNDFNEDSLAVMKYLSEKGIKNIVKTDWWRDVQEHLLHTYGSMVYIEELHSCDNAFLKCNKLSAKGIIKPGKEEEYIIIGDSLISDIAFAKANGIKSIWFNHNFKKENTTPYQPTFEVPSLLEVMGII